MLLIRCILVRFYSQNNREHFYLIYNSYVVKNRKICDLGAVKKILTYVAPTSGNTDFHISFYSKNPTYRRIYMVFTFFSVRGTVIEDIENFAENLKKQIVSFQPNPNHDFTGKGIFRWTIFINAI